MPTPEADAAFAAGEEAAERAMHAETIFWERACLTEVADFLCRDGVTPTTARLFIAGMHSVLNGVTRP